MHLKQGDKGPKVREWQEFLRTQGYGITTDGDFGPKTHESTRLFQFDEGLTGDGIVGPATVMAASRLGYVGAGLSKPPQSGKMSVSPRGVAFIKSFEREILRVYDDGYGFPTVGVGHLVKPEDGLKLGERITKERSDAFFAKDLADHAEPVDELVKVPLTQGQYDALVSLVFNIGGGNFKKSTVLRQLNLGNYAAAKAHFDDWIKSNGQVSRGLVRRRNEEQIIFDS